jgi:hypothetical protein
LDWQYLHCTVQETALCSEEVTFEKKEQEEIKEEKAKCQIPGT